MRKCLLVLLATLIMYGCADGEASEIKEGISAKETNRVATDLDLVFYNMCKYQYKERDVEYFKNSIACEDHGIYIEVLKDNDTEKIISVIFQGRGDQEREVLNQLNSLLTLYHKENISLKEFRDIPSGKYKQIGDYYYNKSITEGKMMLTLAKETGK